MAFPIELFGQHGLHNMFFHFHLVVPPSPMEVEENHYSIEQARIKTNKVRNFLKNIVKQTKMEIMKQ